MPDERALATAHVALDAGIRLFDTADANRSRRSKALLDRGLESVRDQVIIVSTVGEIGWSTGQKFRYEAPEHITTCCDASLFRLRGNHIDLYLCHRPRPAQPEVFLEPRERR